MTDPTPLSTAAQAVLDATFDHWPGGHNHPNKRVCLAAALRAVADQVVPEHYDPPREGSFPEAGAFVDGKSVRNEDARYQLLAIAAELEGANGGSQRHPCPAHRTGADR